MIEGIIPTRRLTGMKILQNMRHGKVIKKMAISRPELTSKLLLQLDSSLMLLQQMVIMGD